MTAASSRPTNATIAALLEALDRDFREFRDEMRNGYVRIDVWKETVGRLHDRQDALVAEMSELKAEHAATAKQSSDNRKWLIGAFVAPVISAIIIAVILGSLGA